MKTSSLSHKARTTSTFTRRISISARGIARRGFTLPEVLLTLAVFSFVVLGLINLHIFGLKLNKMVSVKLQATEDARSALSQLTRDIHGAGVVKIGNGDAGSFTEAGFNAPQQGNAIQIYPFKTNTAVYVRYYLDTDNELKRLSSSSDTPSVVSGWVTNSSIFTSEDYAGNVLSNNFNNRVIGINMEFYKLDNPMVQFGSGHYYDYYRLQTRVTRRALE